MSRNPLSSSVYRPTVLTTGFKDGPNGPMVPKLKNCSRTLPTSSLPGNINAWDNEDFLADVKATGKKRLFIAGVVTEVRVAFPALSARVEGYEVFIVTDAQWNPTQSSGCHLMTWLGATCELHGNWRNDIKGLGTVFSNHLPNYSCLMTSLMAEKASFTTRQ